MRLRILPGWLKWFVFVMIAPALLVADEKTLSSQALRLIEELSSDNVAASGALMLLKSRQSGKPPNEIELDRLFAMMRDAMKAKDAENEQVFGNPSSRSLDRAEVGMTLALCLAALKEANVDNSRLENLCSEIAVNAKTLVDSGGRGWPGDHAVASNWHAVRYSAAIAGLTLAPGAEPYVLSKAIDGLRIYLDEVVGKDGQPRYVTEGFQYGLMATSYILPAVALLKNAGGPDLNEEYPGLQATALAFAYASAPIPTRTYSPVESRYVNDVGLILDFNHESASLTTRGVLSFLSTQAKNHSVRARAQWCLSMYEGASGRFELGDSAFSALIVALWGQQVHQGVSPWGEGPHTFIDPFNGYVVFRDRIQDADDVLVGFYAKARIPRGGHAVPDMMNVRIIGRGVPWIIGGGLRRSPMTVRGYSTVVGVPDDVRWGQRQPFAVGWEPLSPPATNFNVHNRDKRAFIQAETQPSASSDTGVRGHQRKLFVDYAPPGEREMITIVEDEFVGDATVRFYLPGFLQIEREWSNGMRFRFSDRSFDLHFIGDSIRISVDRYRLGNARAEDSRVTTYHFGSEHTNEAFEISVASKNHLTSILSLQHISFSVGEIESTADGINIDGIMVNYDR